MMKIRRRLLVPTYFGAVLIAATHGFVVVSPVSSRISLGARQRHPSISAPRLFSLSPPQQQQEPSLLEERKPLNSSFKDSLTLVVYSVSCLAVAIMISLYQDFDVSHVKPQGILREQALYGLAYADESNENIHPSYNTVMQQHRDVRLKMWKQPETVGMSRDEAVLTIVKALESMQQLKTMANEYEWDNMQSTMRQPLFTSQLEEACTVLRKTAASPEARDEIGFDWGR